MRLLILIWLILWLVSQRGHAQEIPPVNAFEPEVYQGGNQNWMISQGSNRFIYIANNQGLLEFNGMQWTLYPTPNETIIRAVKVVGEKVYTGCYQEFGYWERDSKGYLIYHSLSESVSDQMVADEHFWNIINHEEYIIFQSLDQFFLHKPGTDLFELIYPEQGIDKIFKTQRGLYFTGRDGKLYSLSRGEAKPLLDQSSVNWRIMHLWETKEGIYLQTAEQGRFYLSEGRLVSLDQPAELEGKSIYSAVNLKDGNQAFGTISDGVYITAPSGEVIYQIAQREGLPNNTVLSLFEDEANNLWVATDNGISCINLSSPLLEYKDPTGQLGTVYDAVVFEGLLYLGTNQGLFYKKRGTNDPFRLVSTPDDTKGQVWALFVFQGQLFCGHDSGTFLVKDGSALLIFSESGTWKFSAIEGRKNLLLQGNYYGLSVIEYKNGQWTFRNKIDGFDYSSRYFEFHSPSEIYISHEYKGIFGLKIDEALGQVTQLINYEYPEKGKNASLATFEGDILYCSRDGFFRFEDFETGFVRDSNMSQVFEEDIYESGRMNIVGNDLLWLSAKNNIYAFSKGLLDISPNLDAISIPAGLVNAMSGYENIEAIGTEEYLIGTAQGYLLLNKDALEENTHQLHLSKVTSFNISQQAKALPLNGKVEVSYPFNSLTIEYAVPSYSKYFIPHYQYRLEGFYDSWSEWTTDASLNFKNLPFGKYQLELRSRVGEELSSNTITYNFTVLRPWYYSYSAIAVYIAAGLLSIFLIHRAYTRYYRNQEAKLIEENRRAMLAKQRKTELELIRLKNEQLEKDIQSKNRELAISTMSLVKKNELLLQIKEELKAKEDPSTNISSVVKTIDKNTDEEETWILFKDAFENADQDFFKKIKFKHPSLTHNDLKLCAYLRLNLSSKEIAPLLNISVRSVEVKRYRLRKKMELEHDEGLVEYILGI